MLILTNTTDTLEVVLGGNIVTSQLKCYSSYRDITSTTITPQRNALNTNNTTAVNIVGSPASSTQRVIDYLSIFNTDTNTAIVTVRLNDNGTTYILFQATLGVGEKIEYVEGSGFKVITNAGSIKTSINQGVSPVSTSLSQTVITSNVVNANPTLNTLADITGLNFPVVNGNTYFFRFVIFYGANLTTTGARFTINGPSFTLLGYNSEYPSNATTRATNNLAAYQQPATTTTATATTLGNIAVIVGFITPSADGDVQAQFASEISSAAITAYAGSFVEYKQVI